MELFEKLREAAVQQNLSGEFPEWLMAEVMGIAEQPERYAEKTSLVERLIAQIEDYDPYAGAGCFGASVGIASIRETLREIT